MSYDVIFGPYIEEPKRNYTSNVSGMWTEAIGENLGDLIDRITRAGDLVEPVTRGIVAMRADPDKYRAMNPSNGWGKYEGALAYLEWILRTATEYPDVEVSVWR